MLIFLPAIARPVKATRALAPGGSFICPYTRAALEPGMGLPVALSTEIQLGRREREGERERERERKKEREGRERGGGREGEREIELERTTEETIVRYDLRQRRHQFLKISLKEDKFFRYVVLRHDVKFTFNDASFNHLVVQIVTLSGALTNTGED